MQLGGGVAHRARSSGQGKTRTKDVRPPSLPRSPGQPGMNRLKGDCPSTSSGRATWGQACPEATAPPRVHRRIAPPADPTSAASCVGIRLGFRVASSLARSFPSLPVPAAVFGLTALAPMWQAPIIPGQLPGLHGLAGVAVRRSSKANPFHHHPRRRPSAGGLSTLPCVSLKCSRKPKRWPDMSPSSTRRSWTTPSGRWQRSRS